MAWLNYHHLLYFRTIAAEGSISKASEKLRVGQPALSAQLKQLEEYFGQQLFERKNRRLILTDAGRAAFRYANQIFELGIELRQVIQDKSFSVRPHLQIGALDSVPKHLIAALVAEARKSSNCHVSVVEGGAEMLSKELLTHSLDIVVANFPLVTTSEKTIFSRSIGKEKVAIYGPKEFRSLKKGFPQSLNSQNFIMPTIHSKLRHDLEQFFDDNKILCSVVAETQDTAIQKLLCADGHGLIAEPRFAMKEVLKEKKIIELGVLEDVYEEFFILSTKRVVENPIANGLIKNFSYRMV